MDQRITFEDFIKFPREQQNEHYKDLSEHDRFRARLSDTGGVIVLGKVEATEEEREKAKNKLRSHLKKIGVLKE